MVKLIHGIRSLAKGSRTMGPLQKELDARMIVSEIVTYGYILVPITNGKAVQAVLDEIKGLSSPVLVGYSNGAWAAVQAAETGAPVDHLVLVSPALHKGHEFPGHIRRIDVFYSGGDFPTRAAKWWRWVVNWLPWRWDAPHDWGEMGRTGYTGADPRVRNHPLPSSVGHSWYASPGAVARVADIVESA